MYPINVVEKETHISKYLLRMWERRYSFPRPGRDAKGERLYSDEDVAKLKLVKQLMEEGYRPSKIINEPLEDLQTLMGNFGHKKEKIAPKVVILLTSSNLLEELTITLKNQGVESIVTIDNLEDVKALSL